MTTDKDITLKTILIHIQAMEARLTAKIENVDDALRKQIVSLESRLIRFEAHTDRLGINISSQITTLDQRLDEIEIEFLPKRVKKLEQVIFK